VTKKIESVSSKTVPGFTHIQRWEDDGGAVSGGGHHISQVAETNNPRSMNVNGDDSSYDKLKKKSLGRRSRMNPFITFLASNTGRIVRVVTGIILVAWGWFGLAGTIDTIVAFIGFVTLLAGIFDYCVFALLFGAPLSGSKIRAGS
jgi:hypothetical protein